MDFDLGLLEALNRVAVESVIAGCLPAEAVLPGVRALDLWSEGPNGAMLLWVERGAHGLGEPELHDVIVTRVDGTWRLMGGASSTMEPWDDLLDRFPPGLHRVGGSSASQRPLAPVFVTWAIATQKWRSFAFATPMAEFESAHLGGTASSCWGSPLRTHSPPSTPSTTQARSSPANRSCCGLRQETRRSTADCRDLTGTFGLLLRARRPQRACQETLGSGSAVTAEPTSAMLSGQTPRPPSAGTLLSRTRRRATRPARS